MVAVAKAMVEYRTAKEGYRTLSREVGERTAEALRTRGILATVSWRTKSEQSLQRKLEGRFNARILEADTVAVVGDLAAVRICVYLPRDLRPALAIVSELFSVDPKSIDEKLRVSDPKSNWYSAVHLQASISGNAHQHLGHLSGFECEVQICSLFAHVWNEVQHDVEYKPRLVPSPEVRRLLGDLGGLVSRGDEIVEEVFDLLQVQQDELGGQALQTPGDLQDCLQNLSQLRFTREPNDLWRPLVLSLRNIGVETFQDVWENVDVEVYHAPVDVFEKVNAQSRRAVQKLGRAYTMLSRNEVVWLQETCQCHRVIAALLPRLASQLAHEKGAIGSMAQAYIGSDKPLGVPRV